MSAMELFLCVINSWRSVIDRYDGVRWVGVTGVLSLGIRC